MAMAEAEFRSGSATLRIFHDKVTIAKHGLGGLWQGGAWRGEQEIAIDSITGIAWRDAGLIREGYIQFVTAGGIDQRDPYRDARSVIFERKTQPEFERAKAIIEERRAALRGGVSPGSDPADQLRKLGELRAAGFVSEAEFEAKKRELLARM